MIFEKTFEIFLLFSAFPRIPCIGSVNIKIEVELAIDQTKCEPIHSKDPQIMYLIIFWIQVKLS